MRNVILHIGHGKTGTSAIQTFLARNQSELRKIGIIYPDHPALDMARDGRITSGNVTMSADWLEDEVLRQAMLAPDGSTLLFSSEGMFRRMTQALTKIAARRSEVNWKIVLAVREPVEMLQSHYQQNVKRSGFHGKFEDFAEGEQTARITQQVIERCLELGIAFSLINYSRHKHDIIKIFMRSLPGGETLDPALFARAEHERVNRSLTLGELELVRNVNEVIGQSAGAVLSDVLVESLPDLPSAHVPVTRPIFDQLKEKLGPAVAVINQHLPSGEELTFAYTGPQDDADPALTFSPAQIAIIARCFGDLLMSADDPAFDPETYLRLNPDVAAAGVDAREHFRLHGKAEGRRIR